MEGTSTSLACTHHASEIAGCATNSETLAGAHRRRLDLQRVRAYRRRRMEQALVAHVAAEREKRSKLSLRWLGESVGPACQMGGGPR